MNALEVVQQEARDAERLLASPLLRQVLAELREEAVRAALQGPSAEEREVARLTACAFDAIASALRSRVDAAKLQEQRDLVRSRPQPW